MSKRIVAACALTSAIAWTLVAPAQRSDPDWPTVEDETMRHYQALLRIDTVKAYLFAVTRNLYQDFIERASVG